MSANTTNVKWKWEIRRVNIAKQLDGLEKVLHMAVWTLEGEYIDEDKDQFMATYSGSTKFSSPDANNFIDFTDLRANTVIEWVKTAEADKLDYYQQKVLDKINNQSDNNANTATTLMG